MAEAVARQGANVALVDLDQGELQESARLCAAAGGKAKGYAANVAEEAAVEGLASRLVPVLLMLVMMSSKSPARR